MRVKLVKNLLEAINEKPEQVVDILNTLGVTMGKEYEVISLTDVYYRIIDDRGDKADWNKDLFEIIEDDITYNNVKEIYEYKNYNVFPRQRVEVEYEAFNGLFYTKGIVINVTGNQIYLDTPNGLTIISFGNIKNLIPLGRKRSKELQKSIEASLVNHVKELVDNGEFKIDKKERLKRDRYEN